METATAPRHLGRFDVVVVGAGLVGLACARELLARRPGIRLAVVEAEADVAAHQSGHNSGVVHGGIYYEPGSAKARLCVEGAAMMYDYAAEHGIAHERCGKLVVAVRRDELGRLDALEQRGLANRVPGLRRIGADEIREIEPNATGIAALHAPGTGIIDYPGVARAIRSELEAAGVTFHLRTRVTGLTDGVRVAVDAVGPHGPVRVDAERDHLRRALGRSAGQTVRRRP